MTTKKNPQRYNNYWEPIYNPSINVFEVWEPDYKELERTIGIRNVSFKVDLLKTLELKQLVDKKFENVDFHGTLDGGLRKFTFKNCSFNSCSLRDTIFLNIKFTNCLFDKTTFAFAKFVNCEFRECTFCKLGISSNATYFENIYVKPTSLLNDFYLMKDKAILKEKNSNIVYQWYMLQRTKSSIARKLTEMPAIKRNIDHHIDSIKTARKHEILLWIKMSIYYILKGSNWQRVKHVINLTYYSLEYPTVMFFGWLSGWGNKIGKTIFLGFISLFFLSLVNYKWIFTETTFNSAILRTLEYWLLFGYTKYDFTRIDERFHWIIFCNSVLGMIWFAALVPIIINKLGRNDE